VDTAGLSLEVTQILMWTLQAYHWRYRKFDVDIAGLSLEVTQI